MIIGRVDPRRRQRPLEGLCDCCTAARSIAKRIVLPLTISLGVRPILYRRQVACCRGELLTVSRIIRGGGGRLNAWCEPCEIGERLPSRLRDGGS